MIRTIWPPANPFILAARRPGDKLQASARRSQVDARGSAAGRHPSTKWLPVRSKSAKVRTINLIPLIFNATRAQLTKGEGKQDPSDRQQSLGWMCVRDSCAPGFCPAAGWLRRDHSIDGWLARARARITHRAPARLVRQSMVGERRGCQIIMALTSAVSVEPATKLMILAAAAAAAANIQYERAALA